MESKEILSVEFRYDERIYHKIITVGIFDDLDTAIIKGNEILSSLANRFVFRRPAKFETNGLMGAPCRIVSNSCYTKKSRCVLCVIKITRLDFADVRTTLNNVCEMVDRD